MEYNIALFDSHINEENLTKAGFGPEEGEIKATVEVELGTDDESFSAHDLSGKLANFGSKVVIWKEFKLFNEKGEEITELLNEKGTAYLHEFLDKKVEGMSPSEV